MTLATTNQRIEYQGNGVTTAFGFPYPFFDPSDVLVMLVDSGLALVDPPPQLNGADTYDYTVTGTQDPATGEYLSGGTINFNNAPLAAYRVILLRAVPETQEVSLRDNAKFPAKTLEAELDRVTMLAQDLQEAFTRTINCPNYDIAMTELPIAALRVGKLLGFDDQGQPTLYVNGGGGGGGGGTGTTATLTAGEALSVGNLVNIYTDTGVAKMRKANATDATKPAHGFVLSNIPNGGSGTFYAPGQLNIGVAGLTPGAVLYLSTSAGGATATAPLGAGNLKQVVGVALSATTFLSLFSPGNVPTIPVNAWIEGTMTASEHVGRWVAPVACKLPSGLTGSFAPAGLTSTGSSAITIKKNGTSIGTINYTAATTNPTFTFASDVALAAGDVIDFYGAGSADATLGDVAITLLGIPT